jgi:hypothetical protein
MQLDDFTRLSAAPSMSLPRSTYDPRRVCLVSFPSIDLGPRKREWGVYLSGALVSRAAVAL